MITTIIIRQRQPRQLSERHFVAGSSKRCFAFFFFIQRGALLSSFSVCPSRSYLIFVKKSRQKIGSKIAHLNQVNFCPEAAHASCPSNGRKGSFSPLEARARYLFKIIIISRSIEAFRAPTSSRAS